MNAEYKSEQSDTQCKETTVFRRSYRFWVISVVCRVLIESVDVYIDEKKKSNLVFYQINFNRKSSSW